MIDPLPSETIQSMTRLLNTLEQLYADLDQKQRADHQHFEKLKSETAKGMKEARLHLNLLMHLDSKELSLEFKIPISDEKLKRAWQVLFKYSDGATADMIANELNRHRTTVSTYLNMLVTLDYAEKFRRKHEIYYKAVIKPEKSRTYDKDGGK